MSDTVRFSKQIRLLNLGIYGFYDSMDRDYCVLRHGKIYFWEPNSDKLKAVNIIDLDYLDLSMFYCIDPLNDFEIVYDSLVYEELLNV